MKGWRWAEANQEETVQIVMQVIGNKENEEYQRFMMSEVAKLTAGSNGALNIADYERTAQIMLDGATLAEPPQGAWTSDITDKARIYETSRFACLQEDFQNWVKRFVLAVLDAENSVSHLYNILLVAAMMMRGVIWLRVMFIAALIVAIGNDLFWRQDHASLFWSLLLISVNIIHLSYGNVLSWLIKFSPREEEFIAGRFPMLSKANARRLLDKGEFGVAGKELVATRLNERVSHIYYVLSGGMIDSHTGENAAPLLIGNIPVMDNSLAYHNTELLEGARYWRIEAKAVRDLVRKSPLIANALQETFNQDAKQALINIAQKFKILS